MLVSDQGKCAKLLHIVVRCYVNPYMEGMSRVFDAFLNEFKKPVNIRISVGLGGNNNLYGNLDYHSERLT